MEKFIEKIYAKYHVPKHIISHMKAVRKVAITLGKKFLAKGIKLNLKNLEQAALLHDVLRVCDFKEIKVEKFSQKVTAEDLKIWSKLQKKYHKLGHSKAMADLLEKHKKSDTAKLVLAHDFFSIDKLKTWEEKIIYYADKRVDHDQIVTLKKRFSEGGKRNRQPSDNYMEIKRIEQKVFALEKDFIKQIGKFSI